MKLYKYLNKSITIMLLTAVMVGFLSCDDDDQDLGSGSLTNAVIQSVNVQSGNDWKEATQVKVGTKIRMEGNNLSTVSAAYFNGLEVAAKDFLKQGNTYIEVVIPQNTPLGYQVVEESLKNTVKVKSDRNEFIFSLSIISWKLAVNGVRVFADVNDLVGTLTTTASIGEEIQLEGAGLNYVSKVYFNGYAVNMTSENHLASTALRIVIPEEMPLGEQIQNVNDENVIKLETELGETYNYSFTISGPTITVDETVVGTDGQPVTLIILGSDVVLNGTNLNLVKEVYCNGTLVTSFVATETALTISVPSDLPVGEGNVTNVEDMNTIKLVSDYSEKLIEIKFAGNAGAPFITSVSHTMAKAGEFIYIYGMNFESIQKIIFPGDVEATDFETVDNKNIKVVVPTGGDQTPGYITVVSASGEGYSYKDINCKGCLFINRFANGGDAYAGSNQARFDGINLAMSSNNTASANPFPILNPDKAPTAPDLYRIIPTGNPIDVTVDKISSNGDDLLKFRFDYGKVWSVVVANSGGLITDATLCSDLAIEFDFYMTCNWTLGAWRWETGKNSSDGDGRITLISWNQNGKIVPFEFYGGWRTMVIPLSQLSCFSGLTVNDAKTSFPASLNTYLSLKAGSYMGTDGKYSKGTDMIGYQLGFGNFRLVPYTKPEKQ